MKKWWHFFFRQHRFKTLAGLGILALCYWFCLPKPLFKDPTCMVLEARDGSLLGAKIAADGQWRFPQVEAVPEKFASALLTFEDKRFYRHPGVDVLAMARAMTQNVRQGRVVSGGSTISMQVIRLSRKGKSRNIFQKLIEMVLATRLEIRHSKKEILALYATHAPFGGNVVGLDAASWRYFGKKAETLSWAEATTLAVLPNSPALIHPGRNRQALLEKRNRVLEMLRRENVIDQIAFELALQEPLPEKPHPLPRLAPHLLERAFAEKFTRQKGEKTSVRTTLDPVLQSQILAVAQRKSQIFKANGINNLAILVLEVETGNVLAYVGNAPQAGQENGEDVDIVTAPRSTGSILKPLLYASMLNEGQTLPNSLWPDIPMHLNGYRPENSLRTYDGLVTAKKAVIRSLNVPFVRMLQQYGVEKFHFQLKKLGFTTLNQPPSHYGLALILGGAEGSLWEITNSYACLSRILGHYYPNNGRYLPDDLRPANYLLQPSPPENASKNQLEKPPMLGADAIWFAFDAMREVERPTSEGDWERFESSHLIAWKTGTSFGFRDGWAIGVTSKYAVGVWVGNADGEGRPGLMGVYVAAPTMLEVFDYLPASPWFSKPFDAMKKLVICKRSGYLALDVCEKDTVWTPGNGLSGRSCPYHQIVHLDKSERWRVSSACESPANMTAKTWFVLPPIEEYYFKSKNPGYAVLPAFRKDCDQALSTDNPMQLIYPKKRTKIFIPVDLDGNLSRTVFKAAHRIPDTEVYWHLDNEFIGTTKTFHDMELIPTAGKHKLTLVDETGKRLEEEFEIVVK